MLHNRAATGHRLLTYLNPPPHVCQDSQRTSEDKKKRKEGRKGYINMKCMLTWQKMTQ